jgi:hypothetical protein
MREESRLSQKGLNHPPWRKRLIDFVEVAIGSRAVLVEIERDLVGAAERAWRGKAWKNGAFLVPGLWKP